MSAQREYEIGIVVIALVGMVFITGWFLYRAGCKAGFDQAVRLFYDRKANEK